MVFPVDPPVPLLPIDAPDDGMLVAAESRGSGVLPAFGAVEVDPVLGAVPVAVALGLAPTGGVAVVDGEDIEPEVAPPLLPWPIVPVVGAVPGLVDMPGCVTLGAVVLSVAVCATTRPLVPTMVAAAISALKVLDAFMAVSP
jgi:hypothetical protein